MRIFLAGATGVIGVRLVPLLLDAGHVVAGMTRSQPQVVAALGAEPVVCDVYDACPLAEAVRAFAPELVVHQLTDLPDDASEIRSYGDRNDRMRTEGTRSLLAAATAAGAGRFIAQSISWDIPVPERRAATAEHERLVIDAGGVVIRYGQLYGPGTFYEAEPPQPPRIHVDDAARLTLPALDAPPGVTIVVDDRALADAAR